MIRHDRRESYREPASTATLAAGKTPTEEETTPVATAVETVETVDTIPGVAAAPAPLTISRQRRMGARRTVPPRIAQHTRAAGNLRIKEEATEKAAQKIIPFVTEEGTVDVARMSTELGLEETSKLLSQIGFNVTTGGLQYTLDWETVSKYVVPQEYYVIAVPAQRSSYGHGRGAVEVQGPASREVSVQEYEDLKKSYEEIKAKYESAKEELAAPSFRPTSKRDKLTGKPVALSPELAGEKEKLPSNRRQLRDLIASLNSDYRILERQIAAIEAGGKLTRDVIDIPRMATDLGDAKAAELLTATGSYFTPKVVEIIRTGAKIVPGGKRGGTTKKQTGPTTEPAGGWGNEALIAQYGTTNVVSSSSLSVTDIVLLSKLNGLTGGEAVYYIRQLRGEDESATLTEAATAAVSKVNPELKGWLDEQAADMGAVLAAADAKYGKYAADYKAAYPGGSKDNALWRMLWSEMMRYYPKWSDQYSRAKLMFAACQAAAAREAAEAKAERWEEISSGKVPFEQLTAGEIKSLVSKDIKVAYTGTKEDYNSWLNQQASLALTSLVTRTQMMQPIPGAEVTGITVGATPEELATAQAELDAGLRCRSVIYDYKVTLADGNKILVQALTGGTENTGPAAAIAKARAAGYDAIGASRKYSWEKVYNPSRLPTIDIEYCTIVGAKGNSSKFPVPLGASDDLILEIADAYGLPGDPNSYQITGRETVQVTAKKASEMLSNAEESSGRLYGLTYLTVSAALDPDLAVPLDSIPVRAGDAKTDVKFLDPATADEFRKTVTYQQTQGTDMQRVNAAYQEYANAPRIEMPGGWSMLVKSLKDAFGNILVYGFDALSPDRQAEIANEIEQTASDGTATPPVEPEVDEGSEEEAAVPPVFGEEEETSDMSPQPCSGGYCTTCWGTYRVIVGDDIWMLRAVSEGHAISILGLPSSLGVKIKRVVVSDPSLYDKPIKISGLADTTAELAVSVDVTAEPVTDEQADEMDYDQFETHLSTQPQFLLNALALGGLDGYNSAVEVYNDAIRAADKVYGASNTTAPYVEHVLSPTGEWVRVNPDASPELLSRVNSPEFQRQYAAVLQPADMSSEDYAVIAPYVTPAGINRDAAFAADVPGRAFDSFTLASSSDEFRAKVDSGELILLPYGDCIAKTDFDSYPDVVQQILLKDGFPMLEQRDAENIAANIAQGTLRNLWDALYLNSVGLKHSLFSAAVLETQAYLSLTGYMKTDYKRGDTKPEYDLTQAAAGASGGGGGAALGLAIVSWIRGKDETTLTAAEADQLNKRNTLSIASWDKFYSDLQRVQLNWEAERPLLQSVYPGGALKALQDNPSITELPLIFGETIAATMPYTLATMGLSVAGWIFGGPLGVALAAPAVFAITLGSEGHQIYEEAIKNGATKERALYLMNLYGSMSAAVETVGDSLFVGAFGAGSRLASRVLGRRVAQEVIKAAAEQYTWKKLTGDLVIQFINQAGQEAVQQIVQNAAVKTVNQNRPLFEGVLDAFVGGLIGTAPFILIPSSGQAIRLAKDIRVEDIEGKISQATFRPSDQKMIVDKVLHPLSQLVSSLGNAPVARKAATLYVRIGHLATNYVANAAELARVRELLVALKGATQLIDQESITRLQAREQELVKALGAEDKDLQSVSQDLVSLLSSLQSLDEGAREAIQEVPKNITGYLEELVKQTMQGRKRAAPTGKLAGIARQRAYPVSTFAKTVADAKAAVDAIRGVPKGTRLALTIAVNDMTYALARLGEAIQATPSMAKKTVLDAIADLEASMKKVYDLLKSLPEQSKVKLLQTVNEVSDFAASARFAASNAAQIVGNDLEYAFTSLGDAIKATPGTVERAGKAVAGDIETAMTSVDIALKKAADMIDALPDTATRELSKVIANVNLTAKDIQTYIEMYSRVAAGEVAYKAGLVQEAIQAAPAEVSAAARRLSRTAKRKAGEGALLTKMAAQTIANDIEYAVQTMVQTIRETPERAAQAVAAALRAIRASLASARLTAVMSVKVAYNDLSYAAQQLIDAIKATPGVISDKAQAAINGVVGAAGKLADQARYMATLTGDVSDLVVGELAYHTNRLLDAVGSIPRLTDQAILDAVVAVDKSIVAAKKQLRGMPATVTRYVNSVAALSQAVKAAIRNKVDFTILSAELTVYGLQEKAKEIRDTVKSSPGKAKAIVADAVLTSRVKLKQVPSNIEYKARSYMSDLKRDILRAEENRLNRAYFSVGEDVRNAVKSEFEATISGRKKLSKSEYSPVLDGLADLMTTLLRAVQGTEFSDEVNDAVKGATEAVFSGDESRAEKAGATLEDLLNTVPGLSKDKKRVPPKARTARQLILDGGSYIRTKAADLIKAVQYEVILEDIQTAETWSDAKVKLENYRDLLKGELHRVQASAQEKQTLSDFLSQVNWEREATQAQREPEPRLSYREQRLQDIVQDRIRVMMQPWGQGVNQFYREMRSSSESVRKEATKRFREWMKDMYGKDWLGEITEEAEEQLKGMGEFAEAGGAGEAVQGRWVPEPREVAEEKAGGAPEGMVQLVSVGGNKQVIVSGITDLKNLIGREGAGLTTIDEGIADSVVELSNRGLKTVGSDIRPDGTFTVVGELSDDSLWAKFVSMLERLRIVPDKLSRDLEEGEPDHVMYGSLKKGDALPGRFIILNEDGKATGVVWATTMDYLNKRQDMWGGPHSPEKYYWTVSGENEMLRQFMDLVKKTFPQVTDKFRVVGPAYVSKHVVESGLGRYWDELEDTVSEAERILKDNRDRPPEAPPPSSIEELRPPEPRSPRGGGTRVAVKEKVEVKPKTEELTETEKEALEKAKKEQTTKEISEEEKKALKEAKKKRLAELAEEAAKKEGGRKGARKLRPGPAPGAAAVTRVIGKVMGAPELGASEMTEISPAVMPGVETEVQVAPAIEIEPAIQTGTQLYPAIQAETQLQPGVQAGTKLQPATQTQVQVQPTVQAQTQVQPAVQTQTQTQTQVQEQLATQVQVAVKIPPWWKLPSVEALAEAYKRGIPILLWQQGKLKSGEVWKAVIDPQKQANLLTVVGTDKLPVRPKKQASGPGSAAKTLQWLGEGPRHKGSADLGVVDVYWGRKGGELRFVGRGLGTDVGMRMPSPTVGISLETALNAGSATAKRSGAWPKSRVVAASPAGFVVPMGSLTWASGAIEGEGVSRVQRTRWYYLPPPYTGEPIPLSGPPHGVSDPGGYDPVTTLQIVGRSRKAIPNTRIDLGFAKVLIVHGIIEEVTPKMEPIESTAVAQRPGMPVELPTESDVAEQVSAAIGKPTVEAEMEGVGIEGEAVLEPLEEPEEPIVAKTRVGLSKKAPRRKKMSSYEYMTTLKGFDPYTFKGA